MAAELTSIDTVDATNSTDSSGHEALLRGTRMEKLFLTNVGPVGFEWWVQDRRKFENRDFAGGSHSKPAFPFPTVTSRN